MRLYSPPPSGTAVLGVALAAAFLGSACNPPPPVPTRDAAAGSISVVVAPSPERIAAGDARRGIGWYPAVAIDDADRVHLAWTDADEGDVLYAVSPVGASLPGTPEPVETHGAAGGFVRLALAPGGVPVISYYHQDEHTLRVAHRPSDVAAMKKAGADVDTVVPTPGTVRELAKGWVGEDIAFGDDAGAGSALTVDKHGRPHLLYGVRGDRVRYARRPENVPAFGASGVGNWEKIDIDSQSGQSPTLHNDLVILDDGTAVASYCDWQVVMAHLKLAVRRPSSPVWTLSPAVDPPKPGMEGASNALLPRADGGVDVASVRFDDGALLLSRFDPRAPAPLVDRTRVGTVHGPAVVKRAADGTLWALFRDPNEKQDKVPGTYLLELPKGDVKEARRTLLERSGQDDPWIDLALRKDGHPVAVWFSEDAKGLKLYSP